MKAKIDVELQPFMVPNFVRLCAARAENEKEADAIPLSALDSMTLDRLCDDFRDAVFKKAGKQQPPMPG